MVRGAFLGLVIVLGLPYARARAQLTTIENAVRIDAVQIVVGGLAPGPGLILILQSDVELRARLSLLRGAGLEAAIGPLSAQLLGATQQELLGEALIAFEAGRLSSAVPSREAQQRERQRFVTNLGGGPLVFGLLDRLGVPAREIDAIARRRVVVSEFLEANLVGASELSPGELRRAYETEEHPFRDRPFEEVREGLRGFFSQRRLEQAVSRWVEGLKQRVPHRVLIGY